MRRVLVTGAAGFVGGNAVAGLVHAGFETYGADLAAVSVPGVCWRRGDLLEKGYQERLIADLRPTHLLYLAWVTEHGRFWDSAENLDWLTATLSLVRAFLAAGGERLVIAGTCAEYERSSGPCAEDATPERPATLYGASKLATKTIAAAMCRGRASFAWPRIFHAYGPREDPRRLVAAAARSLLKGLRPACTYPDDVRDFLHVADVGAALAAITDSSVEGPINIGSGCPIRVAEMLRRIAEECGRPDLVEDLPAQAHESPAPVLVPDVTRLRSELPWKPSHDLSSGIRDTVAWWRSRLRQNEAVAG